jgi:hypothetical protein
MRACYHRHEKGVGEGEKKEGDYSCYTVVVVQHHLIEEVGAVPVPPVSKHQCAVFYSTRRLDKNNHKRQLLTVDSDS